MTNEKLIKANELREMIDSLETINESALVQECEWIQFTFGNGSNCPSVCNDAEIIQEVRDLIVLRNTEKLSRLNSEFDLL